MKRLTPLRAIKEFCIQCWGYERKMAKQCNGKLVYGMCQLIDYKLGKRAKERKLSYTPCQAIRKKCLWCMGAVKDKPEKFRYQYVRECDDVKCPLYIFRFGKNPNRKRKIKVPEESV